MYQPSSFFAGDRPPGRFDAKYSVRPSAVMVAHPSWYSLLIGAPMLTTRHSPSPATAGSGARRQAPARMAAPRNSWQKWGPGRNGFKVDVSEVRCDAGERSARTRLAHD